MAAAAPPIQNMPAAYEAAGIICPFSVHAVGITLKGGYPIMNDKEKDTFYDISNTQSATECTGLMPAMPDTAQQQAQLASLMAIHCPPSAKPERQVNARSGNAAAHPSDAHNPPTNTPNAHPASKSAPFRRH